MNRRTFVAALATLCAWPFTRLRAHENAVKAVPKAPDLDIYRFAHLWDGKTHVRSARVGIFEREIRFPMRVSWYTGDHKGLPGAPRDIAETVFRWDHRVVGPREIACHYQYVSGPKWWEPARPQWAFIGHLPDGDVRCFQRKHARWEHLASYQFTHVTFVEGHGLSGQERAVVISRIRTKPGEPLASIRITGTPR